MTKKLTWGMKSPTAFIFTWNEDMASNRTDRVTPDSIQNLDDVRIFNRQLEARIESRFDQIQAIVEANRDSLKLHRRWLGAVTIGAGVTLFLTAILSGAAEYMKRSF